MTKPSAKPPAKIGLSPTLVDELEVLLHKARRFPLLEALCAQRVATDKQPPWQTWLRLRDAQLALNLLGADQSLDRLIAAASVRAEDHEELAKMLLNRQDWLSLIVLRSRQVDPDEQAQAKRTAQLLTVAKRAVAEGHDLSTVLKLLGQGPVATALCRLRAKALAAQGDEVGALDAWRACAHALLGTEKPAQLTQVLKALMQGGDVATANLLLGKQLANSAQPDAPLRSIVVRSVRTMPWGVDISALIPPMIRRGDMAQSIATSFVRMRRWDLLAQLRMQQARLTPSKESRERWLAALRRCTEFPLLSLLWAQSRVSETALTELIGDMTRVGQGSTVDGLLALADDGLPTSLMVTGAWLASLEKRGETQRLKAAYAALVERVAQDADGLADVAKALRRLGWWDLLTQVRLAQWRLGPRRRETVSFHIKALQAAGQNEMVASFLRALADQPAPSVASRSFLVRALDANDQQELLQAYAKRLITNEPRNPQPWIELIEHWSSDGPPAHDKTSLDEHARELRDRLLSAPAEPAPDQGTETLSVTLCHADPDSWLMSVCQAPIDVEPLRLEPLVEALAEATHRRGVFEVWQGYEDADIKSAERFRRPNEIRVAKRSGELLAWIVQQRRPDSVLEIGSGFGTSGMYLSAALEELGCGHLVTFEPNPVWFEIARDNIARISTRAMAVRGPFEDHLSLFEDQSVGMAFVDAIHTPEAVAQQLAALERICQPGAIIVIDDIHFSDRMYAYWQALAAAPKWAASCEYSGRFGLLEVKATPSATND